MAAQAHYFFLTSLPPLPILGEAPPIGLAEFYHRAADEDAVGDVTGALLLESDLLQRQSALSGETDRAEPVVLTGAQVLGEAPLPEELTVGEASGRGVPEDDLWERYFRHVADIGQRRGCAFLTEWVGFEVALRNALVLARAKLLELGGDEYLVAMELVDTGAEIDNVVSQWLTAENPMTAQKALDEGRWDWLNEKGQWFSFGLDEAAAYARALVLLDRWQRVSQAQKRAEAPAGKAD